LFSEVTLMLCKIEPDPDLVRDLRTVLDIVRGPLPTDSTVLAFLRALAEAL
jgi:hypothetical protein